MLKVRIITAAIGLPLLLAILITAHPLVVMLVLMACVCVATYEISSMVLPKMLQLAQLANREESAKGLEVSAISVPRVWQLVCVLLALFAFAASSAGSLESGRGMIIAALLGAIFIGAFSAEDSQSRGCLTLGILLSVVYGALPWLAFWDLFLMGERSRYIILLLAIVWSGDTGGYFAGRYFGKHKLAPKMSPKKTWEGAVGGILASIASGVLVNLFYGGALASWSVLLLVSVVGATFGQMGDLVESAMKRFCGVKDSGVIVPGHGGFLDRVDGLVFAAPVIWFILYQLGP